jgi:hypothetical protein
MGGEGLNAGLIEEVTMKYFIDRMIGQPVQDFYLKFREFLPSLFSALAIFIIGLLLARTVKAVIVRFFKLLKLDKLFSRLGITESLQKIAVKATPTNFIGRIFFWLIVTLFIIAMNTLKLPAVDQLLERFLSIFPTSSSPFPADRRCANQEFPGQAALVASVNAGIKQSGLLSRAVKTTVVLPCHGHGAARHRTASRAAAFTIVFGGQSGAGTGFRTRGKGHRQVALGGEVQERQNGQDERRDPTSLAAVISEPPP